MYYTTCADCRKYVNNLQAVEHITTEGSVWAFLGYEVGASYHLCFTCDSYHKTIEKDKVYGEVNNENNARMGQILKP